jgi:hypothetical protein
MNTQQLRRQHKHIKAQGRTGATMFQQRILVAACYSRSRQAVTTQ